MNSVSPNDRQLSTYVFPGAEEVIRQHNMILEVPMELIEKVFGYTNSYADQRAIQLVCKTWRNLINTPALIKKIEWNIMLRFLPAQDIRRFKPIFSSVLSDSYLKDGRDRVKSLRSVVKEIQHFNSTPKVEKALVQWDSCPIKIASVCNDCRPKLMALLNYYTLALDCVKKLQSEQLIKNLERISELERNILENYNGLESELKACVELFRDVMLSNAQEYYDISQNIKAQTDVNANLSHLERDLENCEKMQNLLWGISNFVENIQYSIKHRIAQLERGRDGLDPALMRLENGRFLVSCLGYSFLECQNCADINNMLIEEFKIEV